MTTPFRSQQETVHFTVTTDNDPAALPRVLELFALRNITPDLVRSSKYNGGCLSIDIHVKGLGQTDKTIIFEKLHTQVLVRSVSEEVLLLKLAS